MRGNLVEPNSSDMWIMLFKKLSPLTKWSDVVSEWKVSTVLFAF